MTALASLDVHRATAPTPTGDISYIDVGEGPTALFVHGVGTNAYLWRNVVDRLHDHYRCIALDLPLHGRSPARPDQDFSLPGLARSVAGLCDALGLDDIHLVANDTGGAVAQLFGVADSERLRSLTLTDCETHDNVPPEPFRPTVDLARQGALAPGAPALLADLAMARDAVFAMGYEDPNEPGTEVVGAFLEPVLGTPGAARQFERLLTSLDPEHLLAIEPELSLFTVPTLVVWGTDDEFFPVRWAHWLRDTIPGVTRVVELEGARLFFPDERAAELAPLLHEHWAAVERPAA
jgi:pimeloyl-ACP methyl ester carboxylesterase